MKVPEKIYFNKESIESIPDDDPLFNCLPIKENDDDIEYIRTDAFIEKTEKWIDNFLSESILIDYKVTPIVRNAVIENFKNYMKGE